MLLKYILFLISVTSLSNYIANYRSTGEAAESREEGVGLENVQGEEDREEGEDKYNRKEKRNYRKRGKGKSGKDGKKARKKEQNMYCSQI